MAFPYFSTRKLHFRKCYRITESRIIIQDFNHFLFSAEYIFAEYIYAIYSVFNQYK